MARVMAEGWSCGVVAFLRHFCSDLGAMDGIFEPAKSEKSEGWQKNIPPPLRAHTLHDLPEFGGMGVAFLEFWRLLFE